MAIRWYFRRDRIVSWIINSPQQITMAILDSVGQLLATSLSIVHTRLELASVEIEEELGRFFSLLLWSLVALFCACFWLVSHWYCWRCCSLRCSGIIIGS